MPGNTVPQFMNVPIIGKGALSIANTNLDGSGDLVDIVLGGPNGTIVQYVRAQAIASTTAGMIRLFLWDTSTNTLYKEILVGLKAPSGIITAWSSEFIPTKGLIIPKNHILKAAPNNEEDFIVYGFGGDL